MGVFNDQMSCLLPLVHRHSGLPFSPPDSIENQISRDGKHPCCELGFRLISRRRFPNSKKDLLSNVFSLAFVYLVTTRVSETARAVAGLVIPLLLVMAIWLSFVPPEAVTLPATFDNYWLWVHVLAGKVFLGLCMVCAAAALQRLAPSEGPLVSDDGPIWSMYFIAFIAHTVMLVAGSAWAHSAWGRYWSWDTLETSTLVTWLLIAGTLHARLTFKSMSPRVALSLVVVSFVLAFLTFFGLPFLSIGPHKGFI